MYLKCCDEISNSIDLDQTVFLETVCCSANNALNNCVQTCYKVHFACGNSFLSLQTSLSSEMYSLKTRNTVTRLNLQRINMDLIVVGTLCLLSSRNVGRI